jgi:hypothetical protein
MNDIAAKLHSRYNPQIEAQRYIDALKIDPDINCFILIEPGMGYMVPVLRDKWPLGKIIVLHADCCFRELPGVFNSETVWYPDNRVSAQEFLETEVTLDARVRIVEWRPSLNAYGEKALELVRESVDFIKRLEAGRRTDAFFGKRWVRNFFRNMAFLRNTLLYKKMELPIVITGSGPSLESALPLILAARERIFVLAASSSLPALAAGDIIPDMVISTDGGGWALPHLRTLFRSPAPKPGILALSFCAALPSQCSSLPLLPMNDGSLWQSMALNANNIPSVLIPQRGTVTASALELALELTDGDIFLAGMDLSVSGIRSHARPYGFDYLFFGSATRFQPVYTRYFVRSRDIKSGGSHDVYAAWFKSRLAALPTRVFSLGANHEVFNGIARKELSMKNILPRSYTELHGVKKTNRSSCDKDYFMAVKPENTKGRARRAAEALIAALGDPRYAPALTLELSPLLFPSRTEASAQEISGAISDIAKRYYDE